jgi:hypothetical protein
MRVRNVPHNWPTTSQTRLKSSRVQVACPLRYPAVGTQPVERSGANQSLIKTVEVEV